MSRAESTNRPKRVPLGLRNILTVEQRPGYVRRWINDAEDRVQRAIDGGYAPVTEPLKVGDPRSGADSQVGKTVSRSVGGGMKAILMEIPEDLYREDQAEKQQRVDASEASLRPQQGDGQYGKIDIESNRQKS